jgi:hypothetical protein
MFAYLEFILADSLAASDKFPTVRGNEFPCTNMTLVHIFVHSRKDQDFGATN